jgi:hypothetical protein
MITTMFASHDGLRSAARVPTLARTKAGISYAELGTLLFVGAAAAVVVGFVPAQAGFARTGLRIPGSSIILAILPIAFGLALVPRRLAGCVMAAGAFSTAAALSAGGLVSYGSGAMTSLCVTGPAMDAAVAGAGGGWRLYLGLVSAGLASNLLAFLQRAATKLLGLERPGTRLFSEWWSQAVLTYTLTGAVAGLLAAVCWFRFRSRRAHDAPGRTW